MHICFPYQKKLHLDFFFLFCSAFPASNSLQILVRSYLSSELRWQVFSLWWTRLHRFVIFGPTGSFRSNRSIPLGATDFTTGKTVCHLFIFTYDPAPLNESCPLQASHFYQCFVMWLKDQTHSWQIPEGERDYIFIKPFLEIDVKGGERDHIKAYHLEREITSQREKEKILQVEREISRGREY